CRTRAWARDERSPLALRDALPIWGQGVRGVFHCFTGGVDRARRALDLDFHISLSGIVTFPKATDLHEVAAYVPADRLLIETDSRSASPRLNSSHVKTSYSVFCLKK